MLNAWYKQTPIPLSQTFTLRLRRTKYLAHQTINLSSSIDKQVETLNQPVVFFREFVLDGLNAQLE